MDVGQIDWNSFFISVFAKYFKVLQSNAANIEYHEFINLNEIDNIHPEEYVLRMPFYMRGKSTACLLLTTQLNPTDVEDSAYEIGNFHFIPTLHDIGINFELFCSISDRQHAYRYTERCQRSHRDRSIRFGSVVSKFAEEIRH